MTPLTPSDRKDLVSTDGGSGVPSSDTAVKRQALKLFRGLPRHYDLLSAALSFGQDPRWRRALVNAVGPAPGERMLDVATGTGMVAAELLSRWDCSVVGIDQSAEMLSAARARFDPSVANGSSTTGTRGEGSVRVELIEGQAERLPFADGSFDGLTFTYLLRYVEDPRATMGDTDPIHFFDLCLCNLGSFENASRFRHPPSEIWGVG